MARPLPMVRPLPMARLPMAPPASLRPLARPHRFIADPRPPQSRRAGLGAVFGTKSVPPAEREGNGWVCGERSIEGVRISAITSPVAGCGIDAPVRVRAVSGIVLDRPAVLDCPTARALNSWVRSGLKPSVGRRGGGVASLRVVASYACRPRNNRRGARISEHGKGHAVDIAAVTLRNGRTLTVLDDYRRARWMRAAYGAACGIFGTTLGPNANAYHRNHFHFDTAHYRGGPYCR